MPERHQNVADTSTFWAHISPQRCDENEYLLHTFFRKILGGASYRIGSLASHVIWRPGTFIVTSRARRFGIWRLAHRGANSRPPLCQNTDEAGRIRSRNMWRTHRVDELEDSLTHAITYYTTSNNNILLQLALSVSNQSEMSSIDTDLIYFLGRRSTSTF